MKILVDARMLHEDVGIGRYLREVLGRWLGRGDISRIRLLGDPAELGRWLEALDPEPDTDIVPWTDPVYSARAQLRWPSLLARYARDADVTFFPHYDVPLLRHPVPSVVTIHDLIHVRMPEAFPLPKRLLAPVLLDGALNRAALVVAVSERTRTDIRQRSPELDHKVRVVPNGVSHAFRPLAEGERRDGDSWERWKPYLLAVGTPRPHKNLSLAIQVLARLRESRPALRLLVVGPTDERAEDVVRTARRMGVEGSVTLAGRMDDADLRRAYAGASLLLFPSLYEGFGLPPLEAMACGTPVLASPVGALPELMEGVGALLDPGDSGPWVREAARLLDDDEECRRRIEAGIRRAGEYSWDRTAAGTLDVLYESARAGA